MEPTGISELLQSLREASLWAVGIAIIAFFTLFAVLLWIWRGVALDEPTGHRR